MSACYCIGPQNGQPLCPCQMRSVTIKGGRYVRVIDYGPVPDTDLGPNDFRFRATVVFDDKTEIVEGIYRAPATGTLTVVSEEQ